jgi:hypothetical protein
MESVKYTTQKSRPNLFREVSGGLKATITLLLVLFTSIATFGQTTETRYYNGKYTKETALKKVNEYLKLSQDNRLKFVGGASSTYQIDGIWEQKINEKDKITVNIRYLIGDKSLSIEIISAVVAKDGNFIVLSPKSTNEAIRKLYDNQVYFYTKVPFVYYLMINENTTNPIANTTTTTGSNTNTADLYSGLSTEAKAFMEIYKTNPNELKNYVQNLHKSWEEKGSSTSDINAKYIDMYQELYAKDKASAFELLMKLPFKWKEPHLKIITTYLTDEQKAYNRQKAQEVQKKYSNSYYLKTN